MTAALEAEKVAETTLQISREFDAPIDRVFAAWTNESLFALWWGPKDFSNPYCKLEVKPGGRIRVDMTGPDGTVYPMAGEFRTIHPPLELSFSTAALPGEDGLPGLEDFNIVKLGEQGGKTTVTLAVEVLSDTPDIDQLLTSMELGWAQSFDRLDDVLKRLGSASLPANQPKEKGRPVESAPETGAGRGI